MTIDDLFQATEKVGECWNWTGKVNNSGYGYAVFNGRKTGIHRLAYRFAFGEFDESLFVLHKCDNPRCINPAHLFLGTQADNMRDCAAKGRNKTHFRWTKENNPNAGKPMSEEMRAKVSRWKQRPFSVVGPDGNVIHGVNLTQFCKAHGLNQGSMWSVIHGKERSHKGFTRFLG